MPFIKQNGIGGLVWVPEETDAAAKKHNCPDCEHCNHCADSRCRLCLNRKSCRRKGK
jgi:hypothetical protein